MDVPTLAKCLSFLDTKDILQAGISCKALAQTASDELLWRTLWAKEWDPTLWTLPDGGLLKAIYLRRAVRRCKLDIWLTPR